MVPKNYEVKFITSPNDFVVQTVMATGFMSALARAVEPAQPAPSVEWVVGKEVKQ